MNRKHETVISTGLNVVGAFLTVPRDASTFEIATLAAIDAGAIGLGYLLQPLHPMEASAIFLAARRIGWVGAMAPDIIGRLRGR